jgi:hypothetical protein
VSRRMLWTESYSSNITLSALEPWRAISLATRSMIGPYCSIGVWWNGCTSSCSIEPAAKGWIAWETNSSKLVASAFAGDLFALCMAADRNRGFRWGSIFNGATGFSACQNSLGDRPVLFFEPDFTFLGYHSLRDPKAPTRSGLVSAVICPSLNKEFYKQTTFGNEWEPFWNSLWWEAQRAIRQADILQL